MRVPSDSRIVEARPGERRRDMKGPGPVAEDNLSDRIYEAAFLSEFWPDVLGRLAAMSGSAIGSLMVFSTRHPPLARSTWAFDAEAAAAFGSPAWQASAADRAGAYAGLRGFHVTSALLTEQMRARDVIGRYMESRQFGEQTSAMIALPTCEATVFTFDRRLGEGRHGADQIGALNAYLPDLSRASLIAARLGVEKAQSTVAALHMLGLPAAVLTRFGVVLAANPGFEAMSRVFVATAGGGVAARDAAADRMLKAAVQHAGSGVVASIPVPCEEGGPFVAHVAPLRRGARDIFGGADALLAVTSVYPAPATPAPGILAALFDLTNSEAKLATLLAQGRTVAQIADEMSITLKTARTYLDRIFAKTGLHRQADLVAMLRNTRPPSL